MDGVRLFRRGDFDIPIMDLDVAFLVAPITLEETLLTVLLYCLILIHTVLVARFLLISVSSDIVTKTDMIY